MCVQCADLMFSYMMLSYNVQYIIVCIYIYSVYTLQKYCRVEGEHKSTHSCMIVYLYLYIYIYLNIKRIKQKTLPLFHLYGGYVSSLESISLAFPRSTWCGQSVEIQKDGWTRRWDAWELGSCCFFVCEASEGFCVVVVVVVPR